MSSTSNERPGRTQFQSGLGADGLRPGVGRRARAEELLAFSAFVDARIEECLSRRVGLKATLERVLPDAMRYLDAEAAVVRTLNEDRAEETFCWGSAAALDAARLPGNSPRRLKGSGGVQWIAQPLEVNGERVGMAALAFSSAGKASEHAGELNALCEELDGILWTIHAAILKQRLVERVTRGLTRRVFEDALDDAVRTLHGAVPFEHLAVIHLDETGLERRRLHYSVYRGTRAAFRSIRRPHPGLEEAIAADGVALLSPDRHRVARVLGLDHPVETLFIEGVSEERYLGQLVVYCRDGLDALGRDLMQVFANAVSQRLIDYRRERSHLGRNFSADTVNRLLREHFYRQKYLRPRIAKIAILYADINSFTRICETALVSPELIGAFIDAWSQEAVRIIFRSGGTFDKMTGDCVIAHFGPPFYRRSPRENCRNALQAAFALQEFTRALGDSPRWSPYIKKAGLPGLGVAVGINHCRTAVGLFGPNQAFSAFSSGMNQAARLQGLGGFRETLVMEAVHAELRGRKEFRFDGPLRSPVKNVAKPLRYYRAGRKISLTE